LIEVVTILAAVLFTCAACLSAGNLLLGCLRPKLYRSEHFFFAFVLGSACLSMIVFVLTASRLAYGGVFFAAGMALIAAAVYRRDRIPLEDFAPLAKAPAMAVLALCLPFAVLYLVWALAPDISADADLYHVALPARYLRQHGFGWQTRNMMADLPEGIEMLFLFAFAFGKHSAAAMVHLLFAFMTPLGMLSYARRMGFPAAGLTGAALFFLSPMVGILGASGYVDVAAAAVVFAAFYAVQAWTLQPGAGLAACAGLLAGFAFTAKYTAVIIVPYVLGVMVLFLWRSRRPWLRTCLLTGACAVAMMAPWMLKNAIVVANPLAPFANTYFPNPYMRVAAEENYKAVMRGVDPIPPAQFPLELAVRGGRLQGLIGPVFLLLPLALFALRTSAGRRLLLAGALLLLTYPSATATRFLVPSLPFFSLALGIAVSNWQFAAAALLLAHAGLSWPRVMNHYVDRDAWRISGVPWKAALRIKPAGDYWRELRPGDYKTGAMLDREIPAGLPVFSFHAVGQAYQSHEVIVSWASALGNRTEETLRSALPGDTQPVRQCEIGFRERKMERIRLVNNRSSMDMQWGVTEMRVLANGKELERRSSWRLRASSNPWDVPLAFDNNPVTQWVSGRVAQAGMFLEIDFGRPETADKIAAQYTAEQPPLDARVEAADAAGHWEAVPGTTSCRDGKPPARLRRAAIEVLKSSGIGWMLIQDQDPGANDFRTRQAQWGITLVAAQGDVRLYRLD
jgi:hypothetical protein